VVAVDGGAPGAGPTAPGSAYRPIAEAVAIDQRIPSPSVNQGPERSRHTAEHAPEARSSLCARRTATPKRPACWDRSDGLALKNLLKPKNLIHMSVNPIGATKAAMGSGTASSDLLPQNILGFDGGRRTSAMKSNPADAAADWRRSFAMYRR
jgi:hypothetical protein